MTKTANGPRHGGRYERDTKTGERKPLSPHDLPDQKTTDKDLTSKTKSKKETKET